MSNVDYYCLKMAFLSLSHSLHLTYAENSFLSQSTYIQLSNSIFLKEKTPKPRDVHIMALEPIAFKCKREAQGIQLSRS